RDTPGPDCLSTDGGFERAPPGSTYMYYLTLNTFLTSIDPLLSLDTPQLTTVTCAIHRGVFTTDHSNSSGGPV
ncbi:hypothetical protein PoB_003269800, partial [Plakobranchus ocellatus]